jgi:NAD-dependent deacetylase
MWGALRDFVDQTSPSPTHQALARWEAAVPELYLVTQNVDGLHQRAGSQHVVELHGSIWRTRCTRHRCHEVPWADYTSRSVAPSCVACGRPERPDLVLFGEPLPFHAWGSAERAAIGCDLVIAVGTSGAVWPANSLPEIAKRHGAKLVRVDPGPWEGPDLVWDLVVAEVADEVLGDLFS